MTTGDKLEKLTCGGLAFGALCFMGAAGFVVGTLWLSPPVGGRVESAPPPPKRDTGVIPGEQSLYEARRVLHPTPEEFKEYRKLPPDPADQARKQALYEAIRNEESDLTAAEPDPFRWQSDPEGARRVLDRIQAERKVLEDKARKLRGP